MKKAFLTLAVISLGLILNAQNDNMDKAHPDKSMQDTNKSKPDKAKNNTMHDNSMHADWQKSKTGYWISNKTWYKLQGNKLMTSTDGKTWSTSTEGRWQDNEGRWLKIENNTLVWSKDGETSWSNVPENRFLGADNTWYMFDKNWKLSSRKELNDKGGMNGNPSKMNNNKEDKPNKNTNLDNGGLRNSPK